MMTKIVFFSFSLMLIFSSLTKGQSLTITGADYINAAPFIENRVIAFNDAGATNKNFQILIKNAGLPVSTKVTLRLVVPSVHGNFQSTYNLQTDAAGNLTSAMINSSAFGATGIFIVEVWDSNLANKLFGFADQFLVIERTTILNITGSYQFLIHYTDNYFMNHPLGTSASDYLSLIKDALTEAWNKEITLWNLTNGSVPRDNDNIYDIILHNWYEMTGGFDMNEISANIADNSRKIFFDAHVTNVLTANKTNITQKELVYATLSHEFYHGIQWSLFSWKNISQKYSQAINELQKRMWLIEGQAKFLETVFMKDYSTSATNVIYKKTTNDYSYEYFSADFLKSALDQTYNYPKLHDVSYSYTLFWRHLYEHNFEQGTSYAGKLMVLPESCKQLETYNSSDLTTANLLMNNALTTAGGNFTTFASSLKDFAERSYFHDAAYQNWDDPNKNNFYTAISNYTETSEAFNGTLFDKQYKINNSYAFRSHKITLPKAGAVNVKFTSIATGGSMANFYAKVYVADNSKIYESHEIALNNGIGNTEICVDNAAKKLIVLVTRLDANEGQYPDYKITVTPLNLAFTAAVKSTNLPFEVAFANTSTANMVGYTWDFGDGEKSDEKSPTHVYKNTNAYDVTLNYKGCSAGLGLQKKAYITFLPYIEKVEIRKTNDVTNAFEFKREFKTDKFQFSVGVANNFKNSADLLVKVTSSGKLQNMQLTITDGNGASVFSSNSTIPIPSNNRIWEFLIPATWLKQGIHLVSISASDVANNMLLCDREFQSIPNKVDELASTWSPNSGITGIDKNYYFYVEPTQPLASDIQILTENECRSANYKRKATFVNNSNKNYTIDFGDGSSDSLGAYSVKIHYYSQDINTAIIKTLNSVYQEIVTSHLIKF